VERLFAIKQGSAALLTPTIEADDPDDYPDTTAYLNAIPGMAESLIESANLPRGAFKPVPMSKLLKLYTF
jgi:hypothetical protein